MSISTQCTIDEVEQWFSTFSGLCTLYLKTRRHVPLIIKKESSNSSHNCYNQARFRKIMTLQNWKNISLFNGEIIKDFQWEGCACLASTSASILGSVLDKAIRRSGSTLTREQNLFFMKKNAENPCSHR